MIKENHRTQRISQEVHKEIAIILQHKIKDPRIKMVTVSSVKVSQDLTYAKVLITLLNDKTPEQIETSILVLQKASVFIRKLLAKTIHLRIVPELVFVYDKSLVEGIRISNLINQILKK